MNLIISDFDGTLYDENYNENIKFLESIKQNYDIVIATGRNFKSLKGDLKINCPYYICNDGGYILDDNKNIIYKNYIDDESIKIIYERMKNLGYNDYFFDYIDHFDTELNTNVNKLSIRIKGNKTKEHIEYLLKDINNVYAYISTNWINILSTDSTKEKAIKKLLKLTNYDKIYVVGNEINDIGMLKKYNGYLISKEKIKGFNTIDNFLELKKKLF